MFWQTRFGININSRKYIQDDWKIHFKISNKINLLYRFYACDYTLLHSLYIRENNKKENFIIHFSVNIVNNLYWYIPFYTLYVFLMTLQIQFTHTSWGLGTRYRRLNFALNSIFLKGMRKCVQKIFLVFFTVEFSYFSDWM